MRSFNRSNRLNFVKIRTFYRSGPYAVPKKKIGQKKKIKEANFSKLVSYLLYTYLKKSTQKV